MGNSKIIILLLIAFCVAMTVTTVTTYQFTMGFFALDGDFSTYESIMSGMTETTLANITSKHPSLSLPSPLTTNLSLTNVYYYNNASNVTNLYEAFFCYSDAELKEPKDADLMVAIIPEWMYPISYPRSIEVLPQEAVETGANVVLIKGVPVCIYDHFCLASQLSILLSSDEPAAYF